ncbi:MAG: glycosyltransferase [Ruminococcus flavefaciens]|nr:glycosyltransferase [Ruminococcus flavefaciens]
MYNVDSKISIIIAVYNTPLKYLNECFQSVKNQTYKNIEVIIIDDGSEKAVSDFCENFWADEKEIDVRIIHNENHGVSYSRNCGLEKATGDYILFLDSDDMIAEDYISLMLEAINHLKCKVVVCDYSTEELGSSADKQKTDKISVLYRGKNIWANLNTSYIWRTLYSSDILKDIRFNVKLKCSEDIVFFDKVIKKTNCIGYLPLKLYYYRQTPTSITHSFSVEVCKDAIKTYEKVYLSNEAVINNKKVYSEIFTSYSRWIVRYISVVSTSGSFSKFTSARNFCLKRTKGRINLINSKNVKAMVCLARMPSFVFYICIRAYDFLRKIKNNKRRGK